MLEVDMVIWTTSPKVLGDALDLCIIERSYGSDRDHPIILLQGRQQLPDALCEGVDVKLEVLVVDVDTVEVIVSDDGGE
uniref:Uncharacterized protein n=1 Tax=Musa acuminata subsp. malaccensis TaxID=214687 RepID=A0A804K2S5_MUSAM